MSNRNRNVYPYRLNDPLVKSKKSRKGTGRRIFALLLILGICSAALVYTDTLSHLRSLTDLLPLPKVLDAVRLEHNGQEIVLEPGNPPYVVNPRDSLRVLGVETDGWLSWGTKLAADGLDMAVIEDRPAVIRDLMPTEDFEDPKSVVIEALSWDRPLGKVALVVQLDAKDWLQKANSTADADRKTTYLSKALKENPGNILVKTQLAGLYFEMKKYDEAAVLYEQIDQAGKSKSVLERLLAIYQVRKRIDDALMVYLDLLKLSEDPEVFRALVQYAQKHKSKEDASKFLEKHQEDIPNAFHTSLLLVMAELNSQAKNWSKAAATYEKAISSGVNDPNIFYNLAVTYQQGENTGKAVRALERYLDKNPGDQKSWMRLAELHEKSGAPGRAKATYDTILKKWPGNTEALVQLIDLLQKSNDKTALVSAYESLARIQPKNKTVQHNLAILYYEDKKWDAAAEAFQAIASTDADDLGSRKYLLDIYCKTKNQKGEVEILQALARLEPNNLTYYDALFPIYDGKKDFKGIIGLVKDPSARNPNAVNLHNYLLYAYLKVSDNQGALKELEHLVRLDPKAKKHIRQAANLYEHSGDYPNALKKLDQLLRLDPKDADAKEAYLRVRLLSLEKKKPQGDGAPRE